MNIDVLHSNATDGFRSRINETAMHDTCYQYGAALQGFKPEDVFTAVLNFK